MRTERRPAVRPPHRWHFPQPERATLDNGLQVLSFQRPGQHIASVGLVLDTPLQLEEARIEGVATLLQRCLDEGTQEHPGPLLAEAMEDLGAELTGIAGHSATELHLEVPTPSLAEALVLLAEVVTSPSLETHDIDRHRDLRLAELDQILATSSQRAAIEFRRALIPRIFRAARLAGGSKETVLDITAEDVRDFQRRYYRPRGATIVVCGDFRSDPVEQVAAAFEAWQDADSPAIVHQVPTRRRPHCRLAHRPGAVQADIRLGSFGLDRSDPRWADLQVGAYAVGGAFLSRLNKVLREEKGYTYGVHLANHPMRDGGLLAVQGSFRTEVVVESIHLARELIDLGERPITTDEVDQAVSYLMGVAPLRYSTARGVTERVTTLVANGLSAEFVNSSAEALQHVTPQSATRALTGLLAPDQLTLVVVGDATAIRPGLEEDGWQVELVDRMV